MTDDKNLNKMNDIITTERGRVKRKFFDKKSRKVYSSVAKVPGKMELNPKTLSIFLKIGYIPGNETLFKGIQCLPSGAEIEIKCNNWKVINQFRYEDLVNKEFYMNVNEKELIKIGGDILLKAVEKLYRKNSIAIVPISGGLDSRAILAALLELTGNKNIITYTFGTPKTYDYEIGKLVADKTGVTHYSFDLTKLKYTPERLKRIAKLSDGNTDLFQPMVLTYVFDYFGNELEYWSGYLGDPIAGSHLPTNPSKNLESAKERFLVKVTKQLKIVCDDVYPYKEFISNGTQYSNSFNIDEQIDFANRQERYVANHLFMNGFNYKIPFLEKEWIGFMISLPIKYRQNLYLYKKILLSAFPFLFSVPVKEFGYLEAKNILKSTRCHAKQKMRHGLARIFPNYFTHPGINYINFSEGIRKRKDLKEIIFGNLQDFKKRNVIDAKKIDRIWIEHQSRKQNHSSALTLLASLEIILKSFNMK
ncbi:hypothetical protein D4R71_04515 [bacterium]|nr:MAG: hypothetical protein D4R71_04515 [bacterium]